MELVAMGLHGTATGPESADMVHLEVLTMRALSNIYLLKAYV